MRDGGHRGRVGGWDGEDGDASGDAMGRGREGRTGPRVASVMDLPSFGGWGYTGSWAGFRGRLGVASCLYHGDASLGPGVCEI